MTGLSRMLAASGLAIALAGCGTQGSPPAQAVREKAPDSAAVGAPAPAAAPTATFDYESRLGVAGHDGSGQLCLAFPDSSLHAGSVVTLISTAHPQSAVEARVVARRATPWELGHMVLEGTSYEIEALSTPEEGLAIAVLGGVAGGHVEAGAFRADLDGDGMEETFRECASGEGLHLTAWSETPPKALRRWHRYVYLGYDLEANCSEEEAGDP